MLKYAGQRRCEGLFFLLFLTLLTGWPSHGDAATWSPLLNLAPGPAGTMIQLTDGTIMVQEYTNQGRTSQHWMRLTPDALGSYINGTWSTDIAPMGISREYFGSNMLPSGKVFVVGGEYSGTANVQNWSGTGEIYDPVANTWTFISPYPAQANCPVITQYGGALTSGSAIVTGMNPPSTAGFQAGWSIRGTGIAPNTSIISVDSASQITLSQNAISTANWHSTTTIYDPATNTWSAMTSKLYDRSDEEGWVRQSDGTILTYDIFQSVKTGNGYAEKYNPATNTWSSVSPADGTASGTLPVLSSSALGHEMGPILRLADGRVFAIGANGHTALYNPANNTWAAGPDLIGTLGGSPFLFAADDAPAAVLPNGHVILTADVGNGILSMGDTVSGSATITNIPTSVTAMLQAGWGVSGPGIAASSTIKSVGSGRLKLASGNEY